jgi:hypothetical protein
LAGRQRQLATWQGTLDWYRLTIFGYDLDVQAMGHNPVLTEGPALREGPTSSKERIARLNTPDARHLSPEPNHSLTFEQFLNICSFFHQKLILLAKNWAKNLPRPALARHERHLNGAVP